MEKSERKTLFVSFLDGNEEELASLYTAMKRAGLLDDYRIIGTRKPLQALDKTEALDILKQIADEGYENDPIFKRMMPAIVRANMAILELASAVEYLQQENEETRSILRNFVSIVSSQPNTTIGFSVPYALRHSSVDSSKLHAQELNKILPKEGERW